MVTHVKGGDGMEGWHIPCPEQPTQNPIPKGKMDRFANQAGVNQHFNRKCANEKAGGGCGSQSGEA